jgi:Xaa-Pro aminopeptidase
MENKLISQRINSARRLLKIPAVLITDTTDLFYLTGARLDGFWLLLTRTGSYVFTPALLADQLSLLLPGSTVIRSDHVLPSLFEFCRKNKIKKVGVDPARMTYALAESLGKKVKLLDAGGFTAPLREIKDEAEVEKIRAACRITVRAARYAHKLLKPGVTESFIALKIEEYFAKKGVRPSFNPIVAFGPNTALPHHISSGRKLQKNDVAIMDIGCIFQGYCSDLTRTYFFGRKRAYTLVFFNW